MEGKIRWQLPALSGSWALRTVPFLLPFALWGVRVLVGQRDGILPLLAVVPAVAVALGGMEYTLAAGAMALVAETLFIAGLQPAGPAPQVEVGFVAIFGVTIAGAVTAHFRRRRDRELKDVWTIADVTQRVLLRPLPSQVGQVRITDRYLSASPRARIGGDLYAAVPTASGVRLILGDAEGKGLSAVQQASTAMGVFRDAAHEEGTLSSIIARIETALDRELSEEQFITAILAEVSHDCSEIDIINCGHPQPLQLGPKGPRLLGPADGTLPLGLGAISAAERLPFTITLQADEAVLFYTDGLIDARNKAGEFFPLTECASVQAPADPLTLLERLSTEVSEHASGRPIDDIALLLIWRQSP